MRDTPLARSQLTRLLQILLALRTRPAPNARTLAEQLEVSRRTIYRDLDTLMRAGVPINYLPEQQGYRLAPGFSFEVPRLEEAEALALVLVVGSCTNSEALGRRAAALSGLAKVILTLPADSRDRMMRLWDSLGAVPGGEPSLALGVRRAVLETLIESMIRKCQVRLTYRERAEFEAIQTRLSPYRLLRFRCGWHVLGRSTWHRAIRGFELVRIERAVLTEDGFSVPPRLRVSQPALIAPTPMNGRTSQVARLRLRGSDFLTSGAASFEGHGGELVIEFDNPDDLLPWILSLGEQVEVLDPPQLRERLLATAEGVIANHRPAALGFDGKIQTA